ncbi:MAG: hypothetical protein ACKO96_28135 [Flammeovirgaceae bacterium]
MKKKELKEDIWQEPTITIESSDDELVLPADYKTKKEADIQAKARSNFTSNKK